MQGAASAADRRTRAIRRQLKRRHAGESALPALDLGGPGSALELVALPAGEVGVLDGRDRQRRWAALAIGLVKCDQLARGDAERPAVGDEVVHRQEHRVFGIAQSKQADASEWPAGQVERSPRARRSPDAWPRASRSSSGRAVRSTVSIDKRSVRCDDLVGVPSVATKDVRSDSWRRASSFRLRSRARLSSGPMIRKAAVTLKVGCPGAS